MDLFLTFTGLDQHPGLPSSDDHGGVAKDGLESHDYILPLLSCPPIVHSQNAFIEQLHQRISELKVSLETVHEKVKTNEDHYEAQVLQLTKKYEGMNQEYLKKERLQALEELKLKDQFAENSSLINIYKSQTENLEMTVKYQGDYIVSLNHQIKEKDDVLKA